MCCFSRPIKVVSSTHIFARRTDATRQLVVYSMDLAADEDLAMVLPLPTERSASERSIRFVNLEGYSDFFADMQKGFPEELLLAKSQSLARAFVPQRQTLVVHEFGPFEASFVPTLADFDRLDARFKLPEGVWEKLPDHRDHGFAVFQLRASHKGLLSKLFRKATTRTIQPMAFEFVSRDPDRLFFPTVHVHDGEAHPRAMFDHALYCQIPAGMSVAREPALTSVPAPPAPQHVFAHETAFVPSALPAARFMKPDRAAGTLAPDAPVFRSVMRGEFDNTDQWARVAVGSDAPRHA